MSSATKSMLPCQESHPVAPVFGERSQPLGKSLGMGVGAIVIGSLVTAVVATPAMAHGAQVTYQIVKSPAGATVQVSAIYETQTPMAGAQVAVYSPDTPQTPWMTGVTTPEGRFEFTPDQPGDWAIRVRQAGHGALINLPWPPASELAAAMESEVQLTGNSLPSTGHPLPPWLGLGLGVTGCLAGGWMMMRRSPQSKGIEM